MHFHARVTPPPAQCERDGADPSPLAYIRLYADADGHSRFEDVTLQGRRSGVSESDLQAVFSQPFAPGGEVVFRYVVEEADDSAPHNAPRRQFIISLTGRCEVETSTRETRQLGPGDVLLVEDLHGRGHTTRRVGEQQRLTLVIPLQALPAGA